jgi:tetratricopeptide (TPR) repeat protein
MPERILHQSKLQQIIVFVLPLMLYANTLRNDFALDDSIVITENIFVQKGIKGIPEIVSNDTFTGFFKEKKNLVQGGRYRPLSLITFAVEQSLWGNNPVFPHLINVLLYALLCLLICKTLRLLTDCFDKTDLAIPVAFAGTLIFAVHPVHTEVVANIKGRDELLAVLFGMLSFFLMLKYFRSGKIYLAFTSGILLFFGLMAKENALAFVFIIVLFSVLQLKKKIITRYATGFIFLGLVSSIYFIIRWHVTGGLLQSGTNELMNNPFLYASDNQKLPTVLFTLLLYLKLLVFPHPLTYDYYPYHIQLQSWANPLVAISLVLYMAIVTLFLYAFRKKNNIIAFGTGFFLITLLPVSNLFVNIGTFMNERFLFLPSIGFVFIAGYLFLILLKKLQKEKQKKQVAEIFFIIVILLFSAKTISRNRIWKNNFTLFTHDVKISSNSAKGNCTAGGALLEKAREETNESEKQEYFKRSIDHLNTSLKIYPDYIDALLLLGNAHYYSGINYDRLFACYEKIFRLAPSYELAYRNLKAMMVSENDPEMRKSGYHLLLKYRPEDFETNYQLGSTYGKMLHQFDSACMYLGKAVKINPENKLANRDMGVAFALTGKYKQSLSCFEKVLEMDPSDPANYINLGITYQNLGNHEKAAALFREAEKLKASVTEQDHHQADN